MTAEKLLAAFEGDDAERLLQALRHSTASARSAAWEVALPHFDRRRWHAEQEALDAESWRRKVRSQALFCLAAGPPDVVHRVGGFVFGVPSEDEFVEVVALRTQPWRADFAADSLRSWASHKEVGLYGPWWWENWQRVRRYERSGVIPFDNHSADYLVVLVRGLTFSGSIERALIADPELLDEPTWALFQPNNGVQRSLIGGDRYWDLANTWRPTWVRLALGGHLDAHRLRAEAVRASNDECLMRNQQSWYRGIVKMLDDPSGLPAQAQTGPPPPGNRLQR